VVADDTALVFDGRPVVDGRLAVAAPVPAPPEVGVEPFQQLRRHLADQYSAECGLDRASDVAAVAVERRLLDLVRLEPSLQRCTERGPRLRVAPVVDLREELRPHALGLGRAGRGLTEVHALAGWWVDARVDDHLQRSATPADCAS